MSMKEDEEETILVECSICYINFEATLCEAISSGPQLCDYCKANPDMSELELLERKISVLPDAKVSRFPIVIKDMWKLIRENIYMK